MSQENINQAEKMYTKENGNEANYVRNNSNNIIEEEEEGEYSNDAIYQNNDLRNESSSAYFYSTGSNIVRSNQPSSAVNLHFSGSSTTSKDSPHKINNQSSGFRYHLEPSIERDLNSDKIFNSGSNRPKKNSKNRSTQYPNQKNSQKKPKNFQDQQESPKIEQRQANPQQKQRNQRPNFVEESPDSYQLSDKFADRDINLGNNSNENPNEYTYEYISESNSYYKRNLPQVQRLMQQQQQQQQRQQQQTKSRQPQQKQSNPSSNFGDDSEYTYTYELPSSEVDSQYNDDNKANDRNRKTNKPSNDSRNSYYEEYDDDDGYTYTYDSVSGFNDDYRKQNQQQRPQPRAIDAELIPQNAYNNGTPLMPIQMQLRVPGISQPIEQESTNDYTYTYDEPTTEEKFLLKNKEIELKTPTNNYSISNVQQVEIPPTETKSNTKKSNKGKKNKKLSPRKQKIQEKISKLQKNLDKLENLPDEEEETVDINDNKKINSLKTKLANLTGWRNSPQNGLNSETNTYTYTFEYESEVYPQKQPVELQLASPMYSISIEASKKPLQVEERNVFLSDENHPKINLSISPAVQSEVSNHGETRKKKAEQLQEIVDLKLRLQQLQKEYNENHEDDEDNFTYEEPNSSESALSPQTNKVRVKKRIRVSKQVKLSGDLRNQQKKAPKMKKIHKKVKIEKSSSHHHHHHHSHHQSNDGSSTFKSDQENVNNNRYENDEELVTREVVINENDDYYENTEESTRLQLLDESSSPASSSTTAALMNFASPKSPLKLLDEGSDEEEEDKENVDASLNVKIVDADGLPNVDAFCIAILDVTGEARKTKTVQQGKTKVFNQQLTFPINDINDHQDGHLLLLVKKQDLIKNDKLLGKAKIDLDFNSLKAGEEIDTKVQLNSDAGIPTQSQVHLIISLNNNSHDSIVQREIQLKDNEPQQFNKNNNETQQLNNNDKNKVNEEEEEEEKESELKPSNVKLTNEMKNKLKIHKNNFISPKTNDESGIFILEPPSQSPLDAELKSSSSFITDLVRSKDTTDNNSKSSKSDSTKNNQKNINFTKGDKITYNLENDVKLNQRKAVTRDVDLDDDNDDRQKSNKNDSYASETKKKRRIIQRIEPLNNGNNTSKESIHIDIDFVSSSFHDNEDYSGLSYGDYYSDVN